MSIAKLKWAAILSFLTSMVFLVWGGLYTKENLPPYPQKVMTSEGKVLFQKTDIMAGQQVYQRYGLMDHGSIWGHGSQRGPEFSAASLHIVSETVRDFFVKGSYRKSYQELSDLEKDIVQVTTAGELRTNRYDPNTQTLTLTPAQVAGLEAVLSHWIGILKEGRQNPRLSPQHRAD